ncbi:hydroxyacid dehydrogenase [Streptomyces sp. NPDC046261]|uniref:hydroxyacid dehydrogenase n=1 Tax=Streptomyces sp. NPDC046261 TaxID=3157200 RepID=UPI0033F138C8
MTDDARTIVIAMRTDEAAAVLPPYLRARLAEFGVVAGQDELARADALLTGWGSPRLTGEFLAGAPRLRAVFHAAGSVKWLLTPAAWERGIIVSAAAAANAGPVADYTYALIVLASKKALPSAAAYSTRSRWPAFGERTGADARTVGVVGASRIGRLVIDRLRTADAGYRILLYDPYVSAADAAQLGATAVDLDTLCGNSSIVTLHAPELPETRGLLNAARLALIPDGGTVINTARGTLVDTEALARECASGRLDALLDVTDPEPLTAEHPLFGLPNVLITPHIAGAQGSEVRRLGAYAVEEVERWARGHRLRGEVRREDLDRLA